MGLYWVQAMIKRTNCECGTVDGTAEWVPLPRSPSAIRPPPSGALRTWAPKPVGERMGLL